jgi:hypothetical protein
MNKNTFQAPAAENKPGPKFGIGFKKDAVG